MFKKLKSLFSKKVTPKDQLEDINNFPKTIGDFITPLLEKYIQHKRATPKGISKEDWRHITECIQYSFSSLQNDKGYFNKNKEEKHKEKVKKGLILFAHHIDKFRM